MWQPISTAPCDIDLQLAVVEDGQTNAIVFPCRRAGDGWIDAETMEHIDLQPTHWRAWEA
jgi:hypothetical protein